MLAHLRLRVKTIRTQVSDNTVYSVDKIIIHNNCYMSMLQNKEPNAIFKSLKKMVPIFNSGSLTERQRTALIFAWIGDNYVILTWHRICEQLKCLKRLVLCIYSFFRLVHCTILFWKNSVGYTQVLRTSLVQHNTTIWTSVCFM